MCRRWPSVFLDVPNQGGKTHKLLAAAALERLHARSCPGNVRELRNVVHRASILDDDIIGLEHLPYNSNSGLRLSGDSPSIKFDTALAETERKHILATLAQCRGNKRLAAEIPDIGIMTLYSRLTAYRHN